MPDRRGSRQAGRTMVDARYCYVERRDAALAPASAEVKWRNGFAVGATFEDEFSNVTRSTLAKGSFAMCGELHNRTGIFMLKSTRPAHDKALEEADQPAKQGLNSMAEALNLAQVKAELSYLNRLEERRETNVENLKRLKEARDALLGKGSEVAGTSTSRRF
jgi:hypothetical protein